MALSNVLYAAVRLKRTNGKLHFIFAFLPLLFGLHAFSQTGVDSLQNVLAGAKGQDRINTLCELGIAYSRNDSTKAIHYTEEAIRLSKGIDYCLGEARGLRIKGMVYYFRNHHLKYIELLEQSAALAYQCKEWSLVSENYNGIAAINITLWQNYRMGLEYYLKSYNIYETYNPNGTIYFPLLGIANIYRTQHDFTKAIEYYTQASKIILQRNDESALVMLYDNLGELYLLMKKYEESKIYHLKALELYRRKGTPGGMIFTYVGLANVHRELKDYKSALSYGEKALAISDSFKTYDRARLYGCESLGKTYFSLHDFEKAKGYFLQVIDIAKRLRMIEELKQTYHSLAIIAEKKNDLKNALDYEKLHTAYTDSVMNIEKARQIKQLEVQLETQNKQREIEVLKRDQKLSQFTQLAAIAAMMGVAILSFLLYGLYKRNILLKQKSEILTEQSREKTGMINIVAHDLKAPLNKIKGLMGLINMTSKFSAEQQEYVNYIEKSIQEGDHLIRDLLDVHSFEHEDSKVDVDQFIVRKILCDWQHTANGHLSQKNQTLHSQIELTDDQIITTDQYKLIRILDNLLTNASKFSDKGKDIYFRVWQTDHLFHFSIRDEGPGISDEDKKKLFRRFQKLTAKPTAGESSSGLGLSIIQVLASKLGGSIKVNSKLGEGTEFVVSLPENNFSKSNYSS